MKRLGLLFLVLVIALGGIGAAFAAWTDTLTITGTVNTGSLDLDVTGVSSTFVYKVIGVPDELVRHYGPGSTDPNPPAGGTLIASAIATDTSNPTGDVDSVNFAFDNLFPCIAFTVDAKFTYTGTIPARIQSIGLVYPTPGQPANTIDIDKYLTYSVTVNNVTQTPAQLAGLQLHGQEVIMLVVTCHLPQDNDLMSKSATGTATIQLIQWNEYKP
jgi:predicted ribosomally synthesized peptide with SipW-like signal peptide